MTRVLPALVLACALTFALPQVADAQRDGVEGPTSRAELDIYLTVSKAVPELQMTGLANIAFSLETDGTAIQTRRGLCVNTSLPGVQYDLTIDAAPNAPSGDDYAFDISFTDASGADLFQPVPGAGPKRLRNFNSSTASGCAEHLLLEVVVTPEGSSGAPARETTATVTFTVEPL
jgi:hypothetical protein